MRLNPFRRKKDKKNKKVRRRQAVKKESWLSSQAKKAVLGVVVIVISLLAILGYFGGSGPVGRWILMSMRWLFGWLGYVMPLLLVFGGLHLIWPSRIRAEKLRVIGAGLMLVGLLGLLHLIGVKPDDALQVAHEGKAGGYVGLLLSYPTSQALSWVGASLIFLGAFLIGLILFFRLSPADIREVFVRMGEEHKEARREKEESVEEGDQPGERAFRVSPVKNTGPVQAKEGMANSDKTVVNPKGITRIKGSSRRYHPNILSLLQSTTRTTARDKDFENRNKEMIRRTLEHFGINVEMGEANAGPTVTQYTLRPEQGTKLSRITALQNDLALALAAHPIRMEAPIPNKDLVGIEIPNRSPSLVRLRDVLTSKEIKESGSPLSFALGKAVTGRTIVDTLDRLPHLLIAGATGAGKSVCIHTLLVSWLYRNSPDAVRFILIDPKRVELPVYNGIPHLLTPVIVDGDKAIQALRWCLEKMDERYRLLEESGARNLLSFNINNPSEARPFIVIVIDELADLMVKHSREVETPIVRLSQMARAVGIHLVLATQRPSVNVLTGLIKANVPSRIAFSVASQVDSRTIIDMAGAEKLLGNGDMLYLSGDKARPMRIQGSFVSEEEVRKVVQAVRETGGPQYDESILESAEGEKNVMAGAVDDPLFEEAKKIVMKADKASASLLQRRLRIGYARAARLLDVLEDHGVIGPAEGNKPRPVLIREGEKEGHENGDGDNFTEDDESRFHENGAGEQGGESFDDEGGDEEPERRNIW